MAAVTDIYILMSLTFRNNPSTTPKQMVKPNKNGSTFFLPTSLNTMPLQAVTNIIVNKNKVTLKFAINSDIINSSLKV